jgi:hypothetical protein
MLFDLIKEDVNTNNYCSLTTALIRWTAVSTNCLLCPARKTQLDTTHAFRLELTGAPWKSGYEDIVMKVFSTHSPAMIYALKMCVFP